MTVIEYLFISSSIYYFLQYYFEKLIYQPVEVESDPYYRSIYGTGEFSPEAMKQKKLEEELILKKHQKLELTVVETTQHLIDEPLEVSTDDEAELFIKELQKQFNDDKENEASLFDNNHQKQSDEVDYENHTESEQLKMIIKHNNFMVEEGDYLNVAVLDTAAYQDFPKSSISDDIEGQQQWFVEVVGKEDEYLHVSDGSKKWVHVGNRTKKISINDTLMLSVEVENGKINVNDVVIMN